MEEKLNEFRRRKRREKIWDTLMLKGLMANLKAASSASPTSSPVTVDVSLDASSELLLPVDRNKPDDSISICSIASSNSSAWSLEPTTISRLTLVEYGLYVLLWTTVLILAVLNGFGTVYVVFSGIIGIYLNTRTGPKQEGEVSAYSVFNRNCEAIDGTLKAEHFEREFNLIKHSPAQ